MAAKHCHCAQRNASAEMLGFPAQLFVSVVEHVTVNWRASEASETLSGLNNGNRRYICICIYIYR